MSTTLRKIVQSILLLVSSIGCIIQSSMTIIEFAKYPAITRVTISDYVNDIVLPTINLCFVDRDLMDYSFEHDVQSTLNYYKKTWMDDDVKIAYSFQQISCTTGVYSNSNKSFYLINRSIESDITCLSFRLANRHVVTKRTMSSCGFSPASSVAFKTSRFRGAQFKVFLLSLQPFDYSWSTTTKYCTDDGDDHQCADVPLSMTSGPMKVVEEISKSTMTSFEPIAIGNIASRILSIAGKKTVTLRYSLTYSMIRTVLSPAPYDTYCRNYVEMFPDSKANMTQNACLSRCIQNESMMKHSFVSLDSRIDIDHLNHSFADLSKIRRIPYFIALSDQHDYFTKDYIRFTTKIKNDTDFFMEKARLAKSIVKSCDRRCSKPGCTTEVLIPELIISDRRDDETTEQNFTIISLMSLPPNRPTIVMWSEPKFSLLDLLTFLGSHISFWFGLTPVAMSMGLFDRMCYLAEYFRKRKSSDNHHRLNLSAEIRRLGARLHVYVRNNESTISTMNERIRRLEFIIRSQPDS